MLTETQTEIFLDGIKKGLDTESSASLASIPVAVVYDSLKRGKQEQERCFKNGKTLKIKQSESKHFGLYLSFSKAKAELQAKLLSSIIASDNYKAQQWLLERTNPGYQQIDGINYLEEGNNDNY